MSQSAAAKAPVILGVTNLHNGQKIRVRFTSPTYIPTVFSELVYVVPKGFNSTFEEFMEYNSKDSVFSFIHPLQRSIPIVFEKVRIIKNQRPGEVKPTFTIRLIPIKSNPFLSPEYSRVSIGDFNSKTFDIDLDINATTSRFTWGQAVGMVAPMYNDVEIEQYLLPDTIKSPITTIQKQDVYNAMGISVVNNTLTFVDLVWMGRIKHIKHRGGGPKEQLKVDFNQVIPLTKTFPVFKGNVTDLKTALQYAYEPNYGWQKQKIEKKLNDLVADNRLEQSAATTFITTINAIMFGEKPLLIQRYFRVLPNLKNEEEVNVPYKYKANVGTTALLLRDTLESSRFAPLGSGLQLKSNNAIIKNASKKIKSVSGANPFSCMIECAKDPSCDMYNVIYGTCNLYDMQERSKDIVQGSLNDLLTTDPLTYSPDQKTYITQNDIAISQADVPNVYNAWLDSSRVSKKELDMLMNYSKKDKQFATYVNETLESIQSDIKLTKGEETIETFLDTDSEHALNSSLLSYKIAYKHAQNYKNELNSAKTQVEFTNNNKMYYNLFTTSLWIINIACFIGILYILIVGFMGDTSSSSGAPGASSGWGLSNMFGTTKSSEAAPSTSSSGYFRLKLPNLFGSSKPSSDAPVKPSSGLGIPNVFGSSKPSLDAPVKPSSGLGVPNVFGSSKPSLDAPVKPSSGLGIPNVFGSSKPSLDAPVKPSSGLGIPNVFGSSKPFSGISSSDLNPTSGVTPKFA